MALSQTLPQLEQRRQQLNWELEEVADFRPGMRSADFRKRAVCVGSAVVKAGCKTVVGQRLKRSGLPWRARGPNAIITLRCLIFSGHWKVFREPRAIA